MDIDDIGGRTRSARSLLTTMLGEFVVPLGDTVWTATIIEGLALLDISERNARQAVARLAEHDVVEAQRVGRRARWKVTPTGRRYLTEGATRIYEFGQFRSDWDEQWLMVVCSVPESQRSLRRRLREMLTFEGFGYVAPHIAVSPHSDRRDAAQRVLRELGLDQIALTMTGEIEPRSVAVGAWDLDALEKDYVVFSEEFTSMAPATDAEAFAATLQLVDDWRRFPFRDPELPEALLPPSWPGLKARVVFEECRNAWSSGAKKWYEAVETASHAE